ncbi:sulfatase [Flavivirga spongiicola]|uniref:Sulfatase-like hydrolase/transferase n=1 Tax=Flavivirga spongiicola TaxID=421621 RepID=A0ABU7XW91_9FLAO|nr:sulfatase-like hydrolase/transferase [Flavivirga sp. MEBiC05379]MDO5980050.1 sulfatase-like hydrolase/transferase [Flavivirga sp. MEBiC05379]
MKIFYKIVFFLICTSALSQVERPNILLIITDQHTSSALSCMGNTDLKTPNIDRIAEQGTLFKKTYVSYPICSPSRASMFLGKMPHELGVYSNFKINIPKGSFKEGLGQLMSDSGYDCVYGGKWHIPEINIPDNVGFKKIADSRDHGLAESCVAYLDGKKDKSPFFMVASYVNPHDICEYARGQRLPNGAIEVKSPEEAPMLPINHAIGAYDAEVLRIEQKLNSKVYPTVSYNDNDWRQYLSAYYKLIEKVDLEIGKILDGLEKNGLDKNTIVIFTSDHGDGMSAHHWNQKTVLFEESVNVPLIVKYPQKNTKSKKSNILVSNGLDLMPTILEMGSVKVPSNLKGHSILPVLQGKEQKREREYVVIETMFDGGNSIQTKGRALVTKKYKYVIYEQGKNREQLFDLENDPFEISNLAASSKYKNQIKTMRKQLYNWCVENNDKAAFKRLLIY